MEINLTQLIAGLNLINCAAIVLILIGILGVALSCAIFFDDTSSPAWASAVAFLAVFIMALIILAHSDMHGYEIKRPDVVFKINGD